MVTETGRVVAVESDGVWVETIRQSTCGSCAAQKGCGHGLMNRIGDGRRSLIRALPGKLAAADCQVDDQVRISIPEAVILRGSLLVYILPLLVMLGGAAGGSALFPDSGDLAAALGATGGFFLGFALVRLHAHRHRDDRSLQPTLVEVLHRRQIPVGPG
ncbi:transcriptional regulator [Seongchinamella sediminis]|uniref:Transcriptional regulator n=1 Tax=Seongchinamella sediminis TaxID=2283635 RepID=A0A3L7DWI6_9GAMM|nr:SoxR reducing system RseC family protein [Seongchinamella sediminis]RLQ21496.1 transcriptional regulator [Seongchinamella sediminis]